MKLFKLFIGLLSAIEQVVMICSFLSLCSVVFRLNINLARSVIGRLIAWCPCVSRFTFALQAIPVILRDTDSLFFTGNVFRFTVTVFTHHKKTKGAQLLRLLFTAMKFEILYLDLNKPAKKRYGCRRAPYFTPYAPFVLKKQ